MRLLNASPTIPWWFSSSGGFFEENIFNQYQCCSLKIIHTYNIRWLEQDNEMYHCQSACRHLSISQLTLSVLISGEHHWNFNCQASAAQSWYIVDIFSKIYSCPVPINCQYTADILINLKCNTALLQVVQSTALFLAKESRTIKFVNEN